LPGLGAPPAARRRGRGFAAAHTVHPLGLSAQRVNGVNAHAAAPAPPVIA